MNYIDKIDSLMTKIETQKESELNVLNVILRVLNNNYTTNENKINMLKEYVTKILEVKK
jgi:hypothetical protein